MVSGISKAANVDLGLVMLLNLAYEIEGACTSIVAQDTDGNIFHARNMDFGSFWGWDKANETWTLAELMRPLLRNARFIKNGQELYQSTFFAGTITPVVFPLSDSRIRGPADGHEERRVQHLGRHALRQQP